MTTCIKVSQIKFLPPSLRKGLKRTHLQGTLVFSGGCFVPVQVCNKEMEEIVNSLSERTKNVKIKNDFF